MPIIGTYTWTEKKDLIKVIVPLKGTSPNKVDILVTSKTLKVNFSPYIVDIVLHSTIDAIKHKATVKEGNLQITLYKTDNSLGLWGILERKDDKTVLTKLREDSITAHEVAEKELEEKRKDRRTDDERYSLKKQMGLEESERNRLDDLKQEEKRSAEEEVYETFSKMQSEKERSNQKLEIIEGNQLKVKKAEAKEVIIDTFPTPITPVIPKEPIDYATFLKRKEAKALETLSTNSKDIFDTTSLPIVNIDEETFDDDDTDYVDAKKNGRKQDNDAMVTKFDAEIPIVRIDEEIDEEIDDVRYIPPPRTVGQSDIQFTPRVFPTPMRESKIAEEDDWIAKNRRHLKKHGVLGKNAKNGIISHRFLCVLVKSG
jgi:dyslexia susceptibility 1 candidate gene 1 protein